MHFDFHSGPGGQKFGDNRWALRELVENTAVTRTKSNYLKKLEPWECTIIVSFNMPSCVEVSN